jgi:glycosyltransferase involved in cell wall biosynthesis
VVDLETAALRAAGHHVTRFERRSDDIATMSLAARARLPLRVPRNPAARAELSALLRADRPDIVHVHNVFPLLSPSVLSACADARIPTVATLHNYQQICVTGTFYRDGHTCTACAGRLPLPAMIHGCYRGSRLATAPLAVSIAANRGLWWSTVVRFFCISSAQRDLLVKAGMPPDKLTVKYNFLPGTPELRNGNADRAEHVLYLGRLAEEKGIPVLMEAWDLARKTGKITLPLVIAGAGPLSGEVERWARGRPDVRVLGSRSRRECQAVIARSACVVVPSSWWEAFGLVAAESMAAGVPVVAANHGALSDLVQDGVTGLLHRPGDAASLADCLVRMISSAPESHAMGIAARQRYEKDFSQSTGLDRLVAEYRLAIELSESAQAGRPDGVVGQ